MPTGFADSHFQRSRSGTLYDFCFSAARFRWTTYIIAAAVSFLYGVFNGVVLHRPEQDVANEVLASILIIIVLRVGYFAWGYRRAERQDTVPTSRQVRLSLASVTICLIAFLLVVIYDFGFVPTDVAAQDKLSTAVYDLKGGRTQAATKSARKAIELVVSAKEAATPADPNFFIAATQDSSALRSYGGALETEAFDLQLQLAEYRSVLANVSLSDYAGLGCQDKSQELYPPYSEYVVMDQVVKNCSQQIDGTITWVHVIFVNSHIIYRGGPVKLEDVRFVNCTFSVERSNAGFQVLQYATLGQPKLDFTLKPPG